MPCTLNDHIYIGRLTVGPAYFGIDPITGVALPNAIAPWMVTNFNNGFHTFINNMWSHYQASGCSWWANRVTHWQNQINATNWPALPNNTYNPYQLQLKLAKILFAQSMHLACGCSGPVPQIIGGGGSLSKVINKLNIDLFNSILNKIEAEAAYGTVVVKDIPASGEPVSRQTPLELSSTMDLRDVSTTEIKRLIREIQTIPKENDELYLVYKYLVTTLWKRQQL